MVCQSASQGLECAFHHVFWEFLPCGNYWKNFRKSNPKLLTGPVGFAIIKAERKGNQMTKQTKNNDARSKGKSQGMNWIRQEKRLAIYLRDGLACAYCGHSVENGASLSLDHVKPHSKGGDNHESNLVTCCERCNKSRGNRSLRAFTRAVAEYLHHGVEPKEIENHVRACTRRDLKAHKAEAKGMVARRGSAARVLAEM